MAEDKPNGAKPDPDSDSSKGLPKREPKEPIDGKDVAGSGEADGGNDER